MALKKGETHNRRGRPPIAKAWAPLFREVAEMPHEKLEQAYLATRLKTCKLPQIRCIAIKVFHDLHCRKTIPQPLLHMVMERMDGKVVEAVQVFDWRKEAAAAGIDPNDLLSLLEKKLLKAEKEDE